MAIILGAVVLVVAIAALAFSGELFQGRFFFKKGFCDLNPKGVSEVASWVPVTWNSTFEPPSNESTEVISLVPGEAGVSEVASWVPVTWNSTFEPPSNESTEVISQVPCITDFYADEQHRFVHPLDEVSNPVVQDGIQPNMQILDQQRTLDVNQTEINLNRQFQR